MFKGILISVIVSIALLFASCSPPPSPVSGSKVPETELKPVEKPAAAESWEGEWQRTVAAARKEGKLVVYTTAGSDPRRLLSRGFKDRFGLDIEWTVGRGAELSQKLIQERAAGIYLADVYFAGATTQINVLKPYGILDPIKPQLILPEVLDTRAWYGGKMHFVDREQVYLIPVILYPSTPLALNTSIVKPEEISSYNNLLEPRWKEKIVYGDPTIAGAGLRAFRVLPIIMGSDFMKKLAENKPIIIREDRLAVEWVARGKYPILLGIKPDPIVEFIAAGAPLKEWIPKEGSWISGGAGVLSFINRAPRPNAAKVYINWLLSKEGSTTYSQAVGVQASRVDVSIDHLPLNERRDPAKKYFVSETEEFLINDMEDLKLAKEIFGPLLK